MTANIKWIVFGIVLAGLIVLFIWGDKIPAGSIFAGLATFVAAIKSKLLGIDKLPGKLNAIRQSHIAKRDAWRLEKLYYDEQADILKKKIDSLSHRIDKLYERQKRAEESAHSSGKRSEEEILRWLDQKN